MAGLGKDGDFKSGDFKESVEQQEEGLQNLLKMKGSQTVDQFHRRLGDLLWEQVGMIRSKETLVKAQQQIAELRNEFWHEVNVPGEANYKNQEIEKAGRVADFLELAELMAKDALGRNESCGCHFREEFQTKDQEAQRNDENFSHVSSWEWRASDRVKTLSWEEHREKLKFDKVQPSQRSYK